VKIVIYTKNATIMQQVNVDYSRNIFID